MILSELLGLRPGIIAVVGSGGKTALLRRLGVELADGGHTVLLCATTKIFPFPGIPTLTESTESELAAALRRQRLICAGTPVPGAEKLTAPGIPMARLAEMADYVLAEADGSARHPLKAHAPHEPVIPPGTGRTICVAGLSGMGRPISAAAHRPELYARLTGADVNAAVTPELAAMALNGETPPDIYFLNQADTPELRETARRLAALLHRPAAAGSLREGVYFPCWS